MCMKLGLLSLFYNSSYFLMNKLERIQRMTSKMTSPKIIYLFIFKLEKMADTSTSEGLLDKNVKHRT